MNDRTCRNCGKVVEGPYGCWLFHACRSCILDATGRWGSCGTYERKWRYFPRWHMMEAPER